MQAGSAPDIVVKAGYPCLRHTDHVLEVLLCFACNYSSLSCCDAGIVPTKCISQRGIYIAQPIKGCRGRDAAVDPITPEEWRVCDAWAQAELRGEHPACCTLHLDLKNWPHSNILQSTHVTCYLCTRSVDKSKAPLCFEHTDVLTVRFTCTPLLLQTKQAYTAPTPRHVYKQVCCRPFWQHCALKPAAI